jgi:hypothetical protein
MSPSLSPADPVSIDGVTATASETGILSASVTEPTPISSETAIDIASSACHLPVSRAPV